MQKRRAGWMVWLHHPDVEPEDWVTAPTLALAVLIAWAEAMKEKEQN